MHRRCGLGRGSKRDEGGNGLAISIFAQDAMRIKQERSSRGRPAPLVQTRQATDRQPCQPTVCGKSSTLKGKTLELAGNKSARPAPVERLQLPQPRGPSCLLCALPTCSISSKEPGAFAKHDQRAFRARKERQNNPNAMAAAARPTYPRSLARASTHQSARDRPSTHQPMDPDATEPNSDRGQLTRGHPGRRSSRAPSRAVPASAIKCRT